VEAVYRDGKVQHLKVTPESRTADVIDMTTLAKRVRTLVSVACSDRNEIFGLPPMIDGQVTADDVVRLKTTGPWLAKYGESLYGVRGGPFAAGRWGGSVVRGNFIYLHVIEWPGDELRLAALPQKIVSSSVLTGGTVTVREEDGILVIGLRGTRQDDVDTIVKLTTEDR
jgi:alpha-L-fucosidase